MALHADTVWEVRAEGSNNNGGGWHDAGGASADHSQQDAHNETWSNLSISGTTLTDDDAGGKFTAAMLGNIINVLTAGRFEISTVTDADNVELDRAPGNDTGLTGYEGGAVADLEQIDYVIVAGNVVHIKAGTYTLAGALQTYPGSATVGRVFIYGYQTTRGDKPSEANMPVIAGGANGITIGNYNTVKYLSFTSTHASGVNLGISTILEKCKAVSSGGATRSAFRLGSTGACVVGCTAISEGYGINMIGNGSFALHNRCHTCVQGIRVDASYVSIVGNIIRECTSYGIFVNTLDSYALIMDNTIDDDVRGIYISGSVVGCIVRNNSISHNATEGVEASLANNFSIVLNYNNFHGNGDDVLYVLTGDETMAYDPLYTAEDDYSLQAASDLIGAGEVIELDVG